jgi:hypothetical protein
MTGIADGPLWAPIEGVTLEEYAQITAALLTRGVTGPDVDPFVTLHYALSPRDWHTARAGWVRRLTEHPAIRVRYGQIYASI